MAVSNVSPVRLKAAVSVSEMARMVSLSRARFYDLVQRGVFVSPIYSLANRRPFYTADMQAEVLAARHTGIGCNQEYVLFYERKEQPASSPSPSRRPVRQDQNDLIERLKALGLPNVTTAQVDEALATNFPNGTSGADEMTVLRTIYRHLRRLANG